MSEPRVTYEKTGDVAHVRFDNPGAYNALTGAMWLQLRDIAGRIAEDPSVRVAVFRGVGGKAFVSGTDISGFATFTGGADGVAYERSGDDCMRALDAIPVTTIAVIDGWAVGGGLNIAAACDFRIATPDARFGSPIGRTLGNCLSPLSLARIGGRSASRPPGAWSCSAKSSARRICSPPASCCASSSRRRSMPSSNPCAAAPPRTPR
ncbi:enoyl-CoA hydratase-related protein [Bosea vaviloviae]|uniref:enoyl-CoA hydratase-related protein n=1 Tax=Bosea vaviloviae TaxID=1526658 RepID=UPI000A60DFA9